MSFLWELLPGAREARNQLIVGYAWLLAIGLLTGVPEIAQDTELDQLIEAAGPVGVALGLSFVCFLLGSFSDDVFERVLSVRGAVALTGYSGTPPVLTVRRMEEWGIRSELERLEASIDRMYAEVLLRCGLMSPVAVIAAAAFSVRWYYGLAGAAVVAALAYQVVSRRSKLRQDRRSSEELRISVSAQLEAEPETQAAREHEERLRDQLAAARAESGERAAARRTQEAAERAADIARSRAHLKMRLAELRAADELSETDKVERDLLRKWETGELSSDDAAVLQDIARQRATELARELQEDSP